jgi:hypothetical protein
MSDEEIFQRAALHPDRRKCHCGAQRSLERRAWATVSTTTEGPKWVFLWRCACGADAFDHVEGD